MTIRLYRIAVIDGDGIGPDDLFATTRKLVETLIEGLKTENPEGRLWIVGLERIRIHESLQE